MPAPRKKNDLADVLETCVSDIDLSVSQDGLSTDVRALHHNGALSARKEKQYFWAHKRKPFMDAPGCSGCSWLLLAAPRCFWLLLAAPGCSWLLLAA
jgi:hypothetical protein